MPAHVELDTPLAVLLGGRAAAPYRTAFGYETVADLLAHYPRRYARRGELTAISELPVGEDVTIVAEVLAVRSRAMKQRHGSIVEARISDGKGILTLTWFNQKWRADQLRTGMRGMFAGKVTDYHGTLQLTHPEYELFDQDDERAKATPEAAARFALQPIPIYPATATLTSMRIRKLIGEVLDDLADAPDPVPSELAAERGLLPLRRALELVHRPESDADWQRARDALRFQEAFVLQSALLLQRQRSRAMPTNPRHADDDGYLAAFDAALPFHLTRDQVAVGGEIARDLASIEPMNRLIQGEVGSGKTVVALRGMLAVADSGGQSALLAPTEVLAAQHLRSIVRALGPDLSARLMPTLLTGQLSTAERKRALLRIVTGQARIVIGTHALIGDAVEFFDLGLVVVDEQHRFGVDQREALRLKGSTPPHVLVLTATPIPRTVAMTVFGDLDVSTIAELPAGRQGIESFVVALAEHPRWERRIWERAAEEIAAGHQVFVVCPAISADSLDDVPEEPGAEPAPESRPPASVESAAAAVRADPLLAAARIGTLHGRMSSDEKDATMGAFAAGDIDLLVATTVIEVGVDVPNASAMIVLDADRFGVSQLHQLRGRVGRGSVAGLCLFVTRAEPGTIARERVDAVAATLDGFELAQVDLDLRREGDVLGATQSGGRSSLRLVRVAKDAELIGQARAAAAGVLENDPTLAGAPALADAIERRLTGTTAEYISRT
ncbi:MAG TPA: ATP-dependent DNA helicase RecG [Humibacter sp.]|nr:ATP-dependent DNA helicase RecG [Humibacter sp.]